MPINVTNSIIQGYLQGLGIRNAREAEATRKKERDEELKRKDDEIKRQEAEHERQQKNLDRTFEESKRQFDLTNDLMSTIHELQAQKARQELQDSFRGITPPGYKVSDVRSTDIGEGRAGTVSTLSPIDEKSRLPTYDAQDPVSRAMQEADIAEQINRPKYEHEAYLKQKEAEAAKNLEELKHRNNMLLEQERSRSRLEVAKARGQRIPTGESLEALLSPQELEAFGNSGQPLPYGTRRKDIIGKTPGVKLTPTQEEDLNDLDRIERELIEIQTYFDPKFSNAEGKAGIGYDKYFKGFSLDAGALEGRRRSGMDRPPELQAISPALARLNSDVALDRGGRSFTETERKMIQGFSVDPSHTQNAGDAKSKVEDSIRNIRQLKADKLKSYLNRTIRPEGSSQSKGGISDEVEKALQQINALANGGSSNSSSTPSNTGGTVAQRHNNPLNIKLGGATRKLLDLGIATEGESATDGGKFLKFKNENDGFQAALALLSSDVYANETVDSAMKKWSNSGYGADVLPKISSSKKIKDLSLTEKAELVQAMAKREGYYNK